MNNIEINISNPKKSIAHFVKNRELDNFTSSTSKKVLFTVTWPSAVGKDTIVDILIRQYSDIFVKPISFTTRAKRPNEVEWMNYYFISKEDFETMYANWAIFESTNFNGNNYGYTIEEMNRIFLTGKIPICIVDDYWRRYVDKSWKENWLPVFKVFVLPPSAFELKRRLINRDCKQKKIADCRDIIEEAFKRFRLWNQMIRQATYCGWYNLFITNTYSEETAAKIAEIFISISKWEFKI